MKSEILYLFSPREYQERAIDLLNQCNQINHNITSDMLREKQPRFSNKTIIEWADITGSTAFLSQPKCEEIMDERWFGGMAYRSGHWVGLRVCDIYCISL